MSGWERFEPDDPSMFERILRRIQEKIRERQYVLTLHARREMIEDELTIYDIEHAILSGRVLERQRDLETREAKYCVNGQTLAGVDMEAIVKLGPTGKLVVITVYVC
jgi:hypothetical protein